MLGHPAGRLSQLTQLGTGTCSVRYDGAGNQTAQQAPNGTLQTWGYEAAGRPLTTTVTLSGTILFSQTDTLDAAGQRIAIADSWGHSAFGYDPADWCVRGVMGAGARADPLPRRDEERLDRSCPPRAP